MTSSIQRNVTERTNGLSRSAGNSAMNNALASVTSKQGDTVIEKVLVNVGRDQFVGTVQKIVQKENAGRTTASLA